MSDAHSTAFTECFPVKYRGADGIHFPGYCVGTDGSVWSRHRKGPKGKETGGLECRWHRLRVSKAGKYKTVMLVRDDGEKVTVQVHALVLHVFVGRRPSGQEARHLNGRRADNRLSNLAWGTPKENGEDKVRHGHSLRGAKASNVILTEAQVREIRALIRMRTSQVKIAAAFGVSQATVSAIKTRRIWKHLE